MLEWGRPGNIRFVLPAADPEYSFDLLWAVTGRSAALLRRVRVTLPERATIFCMI